MQASEKAKIREMDAEELLEYYNSIDYSKTTATEAAPLITEIFRNYRQKTGHLPQIPNYNTVNK